MPDLKKAREAAEWLRTQMQPYCQRIEIAGSIRRGKPEVKDIELVAIGAEGIGPAPGQLFGSQIYDKFDRWLNDVVAGGQLDTLHKPPPGPQLKWGPRYKRLICGHNGIPFNVDLFIATRETWGPVFVIRTGPADFSHRLVMKTEFGGAMPRGYRQRDGRLQQARWMAANEDDDEWTPLETPDEESYFKALALPCWPPEERNEERLVEWLKRHGRIPATTRVRSTAPEPYTPFRKDARAHARTDSETQ